MHTERLNDRPLVAKQYPPYYIVKSAGTVVDYTDDRVAAHQRYEYSNPLDKSLWKIDGKGMVFCLRRTIGGKELGATPQTP